MRKRAFTLIELLVVIAIIAVLMGILMPSLQRVRKQARQATCLANLRQWGVVWSMYTQDNRGSFNPPSPPHSPKAGHWMNATRGYYRNPEIRLCPSAVKPYSEGGMVPYGAWYAEWTDDVKEIYGEEGFLSSYGQNLWVKNIPDENYWKHANIKQAHLVPLMFDCVRAYAAPQYKDKPPEFDGDVDGRYQGNPTMKMVCINRHEGEINMVFVDGHVEEVSLKRLWTFKWSKNFNINAGPREGSWPDWMRRFSD